MSFGFSVSDVVGLATAVFKIYNEFKEASGICQTFAKELMNFHRILSIIGSQLPSSNVEGRRLDLAGLKACVTSCEDLVYVQILGARDVTSGIQEFQTSNGDSSKMVLCTPKRSIFIPWRLRLAEKKFSSQVPKLQRAVAAHVQSLTAFNTLIIRYAFLVLTVGACHLI